MNIIIIVCQEHTFCYSYAHIWNYISPNSIHHCYTLFRNSSIVLLFNLKKKKKLQIKLYTIKEAPNIIN